MQLADGVGQNQITSQPLLRPDQSPGRAEECCARGLHVGHADTEDTVVLHDARERIDRPAETHGVRVEVTVEHETPATSAPASPTQSVETPGLHLLEAGLQLESGHFLDHQSSQRGLLAGSTVAADTDHPPEQFQVAGIVDRVQQSIRLRR